MNKTATIFLHTSRSSCFFEKTFRDKGFDIQKILVPVEGLEGFDPLEPDLLYVSGGAVGVYQADLYPFLKEEIDVIKARLEAGRPVIGVCLGAQLLAAALGAEVYKGPQGYETGWTPLTLTEEGKDSPARHFCQSETRIFHWHSDTFTMPDGAQLLASSEQYPHQIMRYGEKAIGVQFHPEVHADQLREWYVTLVDELTGENPTIPLHVLKDNTDKYVEKANRQTRLFLDEWMEQAGL